jgi:3-methyladenine DNA glycosylase/8-oxoguanine DNA glycosylase
VLLFAYGFSRHSPSMSDHEALRQLYFPKRRPSPRRLRTFVNRHFGPNAGYAQRVCFAHRTAGGTARRVAMGATF